MSAKSILEADGKAILNYHLTRAPVIKPTPLPASATHNPPPRLASLHFPEDKAVKDVLDQAEVTYPWLLQDGAKFVAKPDQLIKRRGKSGLLALNKTWAEARQWVEERAGKPQKVEHVEGVLRQFLVEPFVPHPQDTEYYININSAREVSGLFPDPHRSISVQLVEFSLFFESRKKLWCWDCRRLEHVRRLRLGAPSFSLLGQSGRREMTQHRNGGPTPSINYPPHLASPWSALHLLSASSCFLEPFSCHLHAAHPVASAACTRVLPFPSITTVLTRIFILGRLDPLHPRGWCRCRRCRCEGREAAHPRRPQRVPVQRRDCRCSPEEGPSGCSQCPR